MPYKAFATTVARIEKLSPHFARFTFTAEDLAHFGTHCLDQRIKLMIPRADGTLPDIGLFDPERSGDWYTSWRALADEERNPIRTYTVRAVRPSLCEVDIDFVLHGTEGPASAWAHEAKIGDPLVIVGPDAREPGSDGGIEWHPGEASRVLLAGDETAAPAICGIIESLPAHISGHAYIEVPDDADALVLTTLADIRVTWLGRGDRPHGELLDAAVRAWGAERAGAQNTETDLKDPGEDDVLWDVPEAGAGTEYAWLAGEAGVITTLRRHLVRDLGIDRRSIAFMGYWKKGRAEN